MNTIPPPMGSGAASPIPCQTACRALAAAACLGCLAFPSGARADAEFGDAPDNSDSYYPVPTGQPPILGRFPSLSATGNSRVGAPGVHHLTVGEEWFGPPAAVPSTEPDANLVNNDTFDDGLPPIPFFLVLTSLPPGAAVTFRVTVPAGAPDVYRYVNMLIDWDRSGDWKNPSTPGAAPEWVIVNRVIDQKPGTSEWITVPISWGLGAQLAPQIFWLRMSLSRTMLDPAAYGPDGWDGSGVFSHGETEDYLFHPSRRHDDPGPFPPPPLPPPPTGGYYSFMPSIELIPQHLDVAHGAPAVITAQMVDSTLGLPIASPPPSFLGWAVGASFLGPPETPPPGAPQPYQVGGSIPSGSGTTATWNFGTPPNIATISFTSKVHNYLSPEEWPIRVRAEWPGLHCHTRKAIVHIFHSWPFWGVFEIYSNYTILNDIIDSLPGLTPEQMGQLAIPANQANAAWQENDLPAMNMNLTAVDVKADEFLGLALITLEDHDEILRLTEGIRLGATTPMPVPLIQSPADSDTVRATPLITVATVSPGVTITRFSYTGSDGVPVMIGIDPNPADGWSIPWNTTPLADGIYQVKAAMENSTGEIGENQVTVWVDNSVPAPDILAPAPLSNLAGVSDIIVSANDPQKDVASCAFAISPNGADWFDLPADTGGEDDDLWQTRVDTGQLAQGTYQLRATTADEAGNTASIVWPVEVQPSYAAWKHEYGITRDDQDQDCDSLSAAMEYAFGTHPLTADPAGSAFGVGQTPEGTWELWCKRRPWRDGMVTIARESEDLVNWSELSRDPPSGSGAEWRVPLSPGRPRNFARFEFIESR